ncbi:MAG: hypothetical protein ACR2OM_01370 [Aestuariivirgaceae bacterium]
MIWRIFRNGAIASAIAGILYGLVLLYDIAMRDPRVFDGWIMFSAIAFQMFFSWRRRLPKLPVGDVTSWMQAHIYCGYVTVAFFAVHTQLTLPDSELEWALWLLCIVVFISGAFGAFLTRSVPAKLQAKTQHVALENIPALQAQLARQVDDLVIGSVGEIRASALTGFYAQTLHAFFRRPRNTLAHLKQSERPLRIICDELDSLDRYLDKPGKETLRSIKACIVAKDGLDYQRAHQGLLVVWLFIHVPAAYALVALSIVHVVIVYAYTSGA